MLNISLGSALALRVSICCIIILIYQIGFPDFAVMVMLVLAIGSLRTLTAGSEVTLLFSLIISIKVLWMLVALTSYLYALPTLQLSEIRAYTFANTNTQIAVFLSAQMVYVLTLLNHRISEIGPLSKRQSATAYFYSLGLALVASFAINRTSFIGEAVYLGNQNQYWGGLPAIFVFATSAWFLLQKKHGITFMALLGLIVAYWLSTGNRSEVLTIFLVGIALFLFYMLRIEAALARNMVLLASLVTTFIVFSAIGILRELAKINFSALEFSRIFSIVQEDRLNVSTVGASVYSGIAAIDIGRTFGYTYGDHFIGQLINTLPSFVPTPWDRYRDPFEYYHSSYEIIGGFGLLGESFINFGWLGPMALSIGIVLFLRVLAQRSHRSFLASWCLLAFCFYAPRFFFYGYVYMHNFFLFFLVISLMVKFLQIYSRKAKAQSWE